jgi:hypothetical protein
MTVWSVGSASGVIWRAAAVTSATILCASKAARYAWTGRELQRRDPKAGERLKKQFREAFPDKE